jgi:peptidoglycan hydrolase-like protein with peptidoglycan-binding domain
MKKLALALLATAALSMPAMAASNSSQQPQAQQSQQQPQTQAQGPSDQQNSNQAAQNQPNGSQDISPNSLSRSNVRQVQQALDKSGFQVGRVDGRWGPETTNALKQFQQSKNVQANGQLDQQTISDLGLNGARFARQGGQSSQQQH